MMKNLLLVALVAVIATFSATSQTKMGIVDFVKVAEQLPEAIAFDKEIKGLQLKFTDTVNMRQQALVQKQQEMQKQQGMMTEEMKQQKAAEMQAEYMSIQQYQQEKLGQNGELIRKQNEFMVPFREKIIDAVSAVAKKEKINVVLDKSQVLYNEDAMEITFTVIDKLKRGTN